MALTVLVEGVDSEYDHQCDDHKVRAHQYQVDFVHLYEGIG